MAQTSRSENAMVAKYKKLAVTETDPVKKLQAQCLARGSSGIKGIGRTFRIMDDDDSEDEYHAAFDAIDNDSSGTIDFN
eukprot:gene20733-28729_t